MRGIQALEKEKTMNKITLLRRYDTPEEAIIVKGMLRNNGINAYVNTNTASTIFPAPDAGISSSELYVDYNDVDKANQLLKQHDD